jgi:hypothetical protein
VADMSVQDTKVASRIANLLGNLGDAIARSERAEVDRFLDVGEYGLALDTLSWILVEENKAIGQGVLREIDSLAEVMELREERFVQALHAAHERQIAHGARVV